MTAGTPNSEFIIIGENIHTTRVLLKRGKRFVADGNAESIRFSTIEGDRRLLAIPDWAKSGQDYEEGRLKHVKIAVLSAKDEGPDAGQAMSYLRQLVEGQERAGARFLDINVDEVSLSRAGQEEAMAWLVATVQAMTSLPVSVDSSAVTVIESGLQACDTARDRPMLNSASLERLDVLDLAASFNARVIVTAAGDAGMPDGTEPRVENASRMIDTALNRGIAAEDVFVDPLIFPIAVDGAFGPHALDAIRTLRKRYGDEIHITGGFSNVSFGIPARGIINDVFLALAIEAGADSGIIDPVATRVDVVQQLDRDALSYRLAEDVLMGRDKDCRNYIQAWRRKQLEPLR